MPQKTFTFDRFPVQTVPLKIPSDVTVSDALNRVLRLVSVGSKRFLTNKVDRSVTGLVARQQVGRIQLDAQQVAPGIGVFLAIEALQAHLARVLVAGARRVEAAYRVKFERRVFHSTFATEDQKEGMAAFADKRPANWKNR